ncbi:alpha-2-macroglobulin family protein [Phaeovulum sp.]|uniref:alpha-2-macroglobulin family protein n=1 Tax=Phaeovulum sp. TaxID=2934796 RepID=UPI0027312CFA|nr:alpha-2-macroglobulin family protein [Phaeovulum sp.]MDP1668879.1 alpha-2-macroglobulin family protein [Phaeovulum sp.]MDZ4119150.1 alpha-2-macroglobulin family protein [Phaeovulum sp.]
MRALLTAILLSALAMPVFAQETPLIPPKRLVLSENLDLVGTDITQIFDTTLEACMTACLSNSACVAMTYNTRNGSCFPKSAVTRESAYQGAYSARMRLAAAGVANRAIGRAAELAFLDARDLAAAYTQAATLAQTHLTNNWTDTQLLDAVTEARRSGDLGLAMRLQGATLNLTDAPDHWLEYGRLLLAMGGNSGEMNAQANRALLAAINGYLRTGSAGVRAEALLVLSQALERVDRGRDMVPALRLAKSISRREDIAAALEDAAAKYGFRIAEHQVEADSASPRICVSFTDDLVRAGVDYASFVKLPEAGLSVEAEASQICVAGLVHGARYAFTFRSGLPAATGEVLASDVTVTAYVRDRTPAVRFDGRAYVLPRAADAGLPVVSVNTDTLELTLLRVSDRNLVAAMRDDYFARALDYWSFDYFNETMAETVWKGSAEVELVTNRDVTTRLPVQEVTGPLGPGVYALQAAVPGTDPYDIPPATQWFVISDLGLSTLSGSDGLHVVVRGLSDAGAREGVAVELVSKANAVLGTATTDAQGYAHFAPGLTGGKGSSAPALVTVAAGDDMAFLSLTDAEFDLSDRGVEGMPPAPPIDVFLTTDRGAYRAGETVNVTMLARDAATRALPGLPLVAVLMRPDGVEYARTLAPDLGAGGHVVAFPIAASAPRGTWRLDVFADVNAPPLASRRVLVEDFLPERIDFDLTLPEGPLSLGQTVELGIEARYLFGAPGANLNLDGDLRLSRAEALDGYPGFRFGLQHEGFRTTYDFLGAATTDALGRALYYPVLTDPGDEVMGPLTASFTMRAYEGSGRPVEREISRTVLPARPFLGIKPMFAEDVVAEGTEARFQIVALGANAAPAAMPVHWVVNRVETRYQWYAVSGSWNWEPVTHRTRVAEGNLALTTAGAVEIGARVDWGHYELKIESVSGNYAAASMDFYAGWYAPAGAIDSPDRLTLSLDAASYRSGDVARLRLVPQADGVAVVSVLSNHLISLQTVAVTAGENVIELPVTDEWGAGAYVTASVLRPLANAAADRVPNRALGLAHATVDPGARHLNATLEVAAASDPRAPLPVALKVDGVAAGETAWATIAAVDLGILNLTGFKSPDPAAHYFGQRRLGIGLRDLYGRLIDGRSGTLGVLRSGGDSDAGLKMQAPPPTEELVAYFSGPLTVGSDGYARTEFAMPAFNGTVRLMAVVWSASGIGQASTDVLVRDPVVVTATVPRFMAPGDQSRLLLELTHTSGAPGRMALEVSATGLNLGATPTEVNLAPRRTFSLSIPVTAGEVEGTQTLRIALTTPDGKRLEKLLSIPVQRLDPAVSHQSRFELAAGKSFTLDANVFAGFVPGTGHATLAVGPLARFDTAGLLASLNAYPYGCTEQITSKALPLLYFNDVAAAMGLAGQEDISARITAAISEVLTNQDASGAFGLWYPDSGDLWLDAYVTDFLSRAQTQGYAVPANAFRNALDNLRNQVNYAPEFDAGSNGGGVDIAYALMVLAREGAVPVGDLRYYSDVKGDDFATPLAAAQLGAALASYGEQTRADAMFARAARLMADRSPETALWRVDYGTRLRDQAAVLALAVEAGSNAIAADSAGQALALRLQGQRLSTQEATWALMATHALIDRPGAEGFTLNGMPFTGPLVRVLDDGPGFSPASIGNGSLTQATLTLTTFGVPEVPEPAGGKGYTINRIYYGFDGEAVSPESVAQGTRLVVVLEIIPHEADGAARLMVNDPLPAGFEIDNPNLLRAGDIAALDWLDIAQGTSMTEFRQDRFLAAIDWYGRDIFRLAYIVRAISPGSFHHPAASVEDMYRPDMRAQTAAGRVTVN